jgi:hypothetical protein
MVNEVDSTQIDGDSLEERVTDCSYVSLNPLSCLFRLTKTSAHLHRLLITSYTNYLNCRLQPFTLCAGLPSCSPRFLTSGFWAVRVAFIFFFAWAISLIRWSLVHKGVAAAAAAAVAVETLAQHQQEQSEAAGDPPSPQEGAETSSTFQLSAPPLSRSRYRKKVSTHLRLSFRALFLSLIFSLIFDLFFFVSIGRFSRRRRRAVKNAMHNCIICADEISQHQQEIALSCGHYFDGNCLLEAFQKATRDESLYPPQCCFIPIPFDIIKRHLPDSLVVLYLEKEIEYKTPRRVYCASPMCSRFLGSRDDVCTSKTAATVRKCTSPDCTTRTCGRCTTRVNEGQRHACKMEKSERQALVIGRSRGWVRCPGCEEMVERTYGCFHMTCRCRTQFCYLCRAIWKTCKCTRWTARAAVIRRQPMLVRFSFSLLFPSFKTFLRLYSQYAKYSVRFKL